jgi:hypothetical protein
MESIDGLLKRGEIFPFLRGILSAVFDETSQSSFYQQHGIVEGSEFRMQLTLYLLDRRNTHPHLYSQEHQHHHHDHRDHLHRLPNPAHLQLSELAHLAFLPQLDPFLACRNPFHAIVMQIIKYQ